MSDLKSSSQGANNQFVHDATTNAHQNTWKKKLLNRLRITCHIDWVLLISCISQQRKRRLFGVH